MYQVPAPYPYKSDRLNAMIGFGDLWSTIENIANKVGNVAQGVASAVPYAQQVVGGQASVAVVPRNTTSTVVSGSGPVAFGLGGMPSWVLPVGLGAVALLLLRSRR